MFWEEPNKAESAKLPGAGIAPKPCPRYSMAEKEECTESVQSVEAMAKRRSDRQAVTRNLSFRSASWLNVGLGMASVGGHFLW